MCANGGCARAPGGRAFLGLRVIPGSATCDLHWRIGANMNGRTSAPSAPHRLQRGQQPLNSTGTEIHYIFFTILLHISAEKKAEFFSFGGEVETIHSSSLE